MPVSDLRLGALGVPVLVPADLQPLPAPVSVHPPLDLTEPDPGQTKVPEIIDRKIDDLRNFRKAATLVVAFFN